MAEDGLSYPAAGRSYTIDDEVRLNPLLLLGGARVESPSVPSGQYIWTVEPPLPEGLVLDRHTGVISGAPREACQETTYRVIASCITELTFQVEEPPQSAAVSVSIDGDFASQLERVTDIRDLPPQPVRTKEYGDWMIWMVHRAWLNDPTLEEFNFDNMHMPPPHVESRIAPKLVKAMETNDHIEVLSLSNSNLQRAQGFELAAALLRNITVKSLNLESNCLDTSAVCELAHAIRANPESKIQELRVLHQKQVGHFFGRPTEEAMGKLMEQSSSIVKLSFECDDANWRNTIDRALLRNNDARRRQSLLPTFEEESLPLEELTLGQLILQEAPGGHAERVIDLDDGPFHAVFWDYVVQCRKLPTTSQLQNYVKNSGALLPYSMAVPLIRSCRSRLLDAAVKSDVIVADAFGTSTAGCLHSWSESNDHWQLEVRAPCHEKRFLFRSRKEPSFAISEAWREWLETCIPSTCTGRSPLRTCSAPAGGLCGGA